MPWLRLMNPPHFRNERWEEHSGTIYRRPLWWLVRVPLARGTAWGAGPHTHRGSPRDPSQPGHCLWDLPIDDKWFHVGVGRGLSSAPAPGWSPRVTRHLQQRLRCSPGSVWEQLSGFLQGRLHGDIHELPVSKMRSHHAGRSTAVQSTCRAQPRWALSLEPSPKTQSDCILELRSLLQHRQPFVCFTYRGDCRKAMLDGQTDGHAAIAGMRRLSLARPRWH